MKKAFSTLLFVLCLALPVFAGDVEMPPAPTKPPTQPIIEPAQEPIQTTESETVVSDPIAEAALTLLTQILSLL